MSDCKEQKRAMRAEFARRRAEARSGEADKLVAEMFLRSPFARKESFFVYLSFRSEVGTDELITALRKAGGKICAPRIEGGTMRSVLLSDKTERGAFGIMQPPAGEEETCAVALVPLLAADGDGYRLGYGGGYYDRYFALHPEVLRVGLCYEEQITTRVPREETDIPLDALVTPRRILTISRRLT